MNKYLRFITIIIASSLFLNILSVIPANAKSFDPGFIISDSLFTNSTSMSADAVQNFIVAKGANCTNGSAPCLKNFTENGKSAGTIIAEVARAYSINPQVLITVLQKEVGLVTRNKPEPWQYQSAMGYGCPDSTPGVCSSQYHGFTNQVTWAAKMYRAIMNNSPTWYTPYVLGNNYIQYHPNAACGGSMVNIQNRATQALYNYTPYQPNAAALAAGYGEGDDCSAYGNRNFWLFFNDWFGSSTSSILIQSPQSPAVYLQSGNIRYGITDWSIIDAYGFGRFGVTAVSNTYMNSLTDGGILNTVFSNKSKVGPIYLADNGYRFGFASYQQCVDWGFPSCTNSSYAKPLEPSVFDKMHVYGDLSPLMLNGSHIYLMKGGKKYPFLSSKAQQEHGYGSIKYTPITNGNNLRQTTGNSYTQNNSLLSIKNNPTIYSYTNNTFNALSYDAFAHLSAASTPVLVDTVSAYTKTPPLNNGTVPSLVGFGDGKTYFMADNKKIDITPTKQDWPVAPIIENIKPLLSSTSTSATTKRDETYQSTDGTIFKIESGSWRPFQSLSDYFALGYKNPTPIAGSVISLLSTGNPLIAPGYGSVFQVTTPKSDLSSIYALSSDSSICQVYSLPQLGLYNLNTSSAPRLDKLSSAKINLLSTTTYDVDNALHIRTSSVHSKISPLELVNTWGINKRMALCSFSNEHQAKRPITHSSPRFVRNEHTGIIYYGEGGKKRAIYSYDAFLRMGGTSLNTLDVSMEFLVSSPDGVPITK